MKTSHLDNVAAVTVIVLCSIGFALSVIWPFFWPEIRQWRRDRRWRRGMAIIKRLREDIEVMEDRS